MLSNQRNIWLDLIRGLSALLVCMGHLRSAILVDYSVLQSPNILHKVFYMMTGFGHQAVIVFFVLSGYFVGGAVLRAGKQFSWRHYLISRLARLWVVLIPCLFITWVVGEFLLYHFPQVLLGAYAASWHSGPNPNEYSVSVSTLMANLFFLQTIATPVYGVNGPLWSLANEFWYYISFPLLLSAVGLLGVKKHSIQIVALICLLSIAYCLPEEMLFGFLIWLMGVGVYLLQVSIKERSQSIKHIGIVIALVLFASILILSKSTIGQQFNLQFLDFMTGLMFALLCLLLSTQAFPKEGFAWIANISIFLSETSYSLYLSHFPLVLVIAPVFYQSQKMTFDDFILVQFFGWVLLLLVMGGVLWYLFESRTQFVRQQLEAMLKLRTITKGHA
jgi:peptidoglycan/LPS O-acetylase OafA/YrhL